MVGVIRSWQDRKQPFRIPRREKLSFLVSAAPPHGAIQGSLLPAEPRELCRFTEQP